MAPLRERVRGLPGRPGRARPRARARAPRGRAGWRRRRSRPFTRGSGFLPPAGARVTVYGPSRADRAADRDPLRGRRSEGDDRRSSSSCASPLPVAGPPRPRGRPLHRAPRRPLRGGDHVLQRAVARAAADDRVRDRRVTCCSAARTCSNEIQRRDHRGRARRAGRHDQPDHRPGDPARRARSAAFGLLAALYSGIGWMTNLREALSEQWAQVPEPPAAGPKRLLFDLLALLGLGVALVGLVRDHRRWRPASPRTVLELRRAGRAGLGAGAARAAGRPARPRRELADLPLGDRPAAARATSLCERGEGGRCWGRSGSRCSSRS